MREFGASDETIEEALALQQPETPDCEVWQENWQTTTLFLALRRQWRVCMGMGGMLWLGLDYGGVEVMMRIKGIKKKARAGLLDELQIMEDAALELLNKQDD